MLIHYMLLMVLQIGPKDNWLQNTQLKNEFPLFKQTII